MDEQQQSTAAPKNSMGPVIAIIGIIVIVAVGIFAYQNMNKPQTENVTTEAMQQQTAQPTQETAAQPTTGETVTAQTYKDGEYTAVGNYTSPGGAEQIGVTLTIANGVVTDSTVEVKATRPMSKAKQTEFSQNYKTQVVGKNIDEINLVKVAGSSLSPKGFNDAVEQIKSEAQA